MNKVSKFFYILLSLGFILTISSCSVFGNGPKAPQCPSHSLIDNPCLEVLV